MGAVVALYLLAPWTAECSWGGFTLPGFGLVVVFLGPLYGGAALLIRETARRTGGGWPAIALLAAAFGVVQVGLVDQSAFNPEFLADTQFADSALTRFPAGALFGWIGNHVVLSIGAPIAVVESLVAPERRHRPWLRRRGLCGAAALFLLGAWIVFADDADGRKGFAAAPEQLLGAALVAVVLVVAGLVVAGLAGRRRDSSVDRPAPRPLLVGVVTGGAYLGSDLVPGWPGLVLRTAVVAFAVTVVVRWSRRAGWAQPHVLAGWTAPLLVVAALAWVVPTYAPASPGAALLGDLAVTVVAVCVVGAAVLRLRRLGSPSCRSNGHGGSPRSASPA